MRMALGRYTLLTIPGSYAWALLFAGIGWAAGSKWEEFHHSFRYAEYVVAAAILIVIVVGFVRHRRSSRLGRRAEDPAG
jgi:membrane protein DedA with SNARE-associated domain